MPLPDNFSPWEHLQSVLRTYHNQLVRDEFSDIEGDDNLGIPRGSLKLACLLDDDDTVDMTLLRLLLFFFHARKAQDMQTPVYGIPISVYDSNVKYHPTVSLYFEEDYEQVPNNRQPVRAEISYRLMNETPQSITPADALSLANKVKTEFSSNNGYRWRKGKILTTYRDLSNGYNLQIYAYSEAEAREVIAKILDLKNQTIDNEFLTVHEPKGTFPMNPGTHLVYGKQRPKPIRRPTTYVRFIRATLTMPGLEKGIALVDRRNYYKALVRP